MLRKHWERVGGSVDLTRTLYNNNQVIDWLVNPSPTRYLDRPNELRAHTLTSDHSSIRFDQDIQGGWPAPRNFLVILARHVRPRPSARSPLTRSPAVSGLAAG